MADRDSAFLWETAALRSSPQRVAESETDRETPDRSNGRWVTLREANRATGIPVETLRKWARRSTVPTYLTPTSGGTNIRMVDLAGVERRAAELGRDLPATSQSRESAAAPTGSAPAETVGSPPGTMIVPIDAWNKMLNQLGNLHQAGQQLAEARERAAKAETEAAFLRERLAELRTGTSTAATPSAEAASPPAAAPPPTQQPPEKVWQFLVRRMRGHKR